jgi:hypothetical protein
MDTKTLVLGSFTLTGSEMLMLTKVLGKDNFLKSKTLEYFKLLGYKDISYFKIPEEAIYYRQSTPDNPIIEVVYDVVVRG